MTINGMEKLTLVDYPEKIACVIFTQGCNLKCPFCHNAPLIADKDNDGKIDEEEVLAYLEKRKKVLDGICITGGEPLLQKDLKQFIIKIKNLGYKVKLDTNGTSPKKLKDLLDSNLLDYVAMDIKNDLSHYKKTSGVCELDLNKIQDSIKIIEESGVDYEFRTTVVKELHDINEIKNICDLIGPNAKYYLQNYVDSENVLTKGLSGFKESELKKMKEILNENYPNVRIRGI